VCIVASGTLPYLALMHLPLHYILFVVTVQAERLGIGHEKIRIGRSMRLMTNLAPARGNRSMNLLLAGEHNGSMTAQAQFFNRGYEVIRARHVTTTAQFSGKGSVFPVPDLSGIGILICVIGIIALRQDFLLGVRHPIKKEAQRPVSRYRRTSHNAKNGNDAKNYIHPFS
jgi:hypothetical protein